MIRGNYWGSWIVLIVLAVFVALVLWAEGAFGATVEKPDIVELLEIKGAIDQGTVRQTRSFVEGMAEPKAANIKAVVLVVDSPGGSVTATRAVWQELNALKVPVVAWCEYVCASGGFYVVMAAPIQVIGMSDYTITGSIGTVASWWNVARLLDWLMVDPQLYTSGSLKAAGAEDQRPSPAERAYIQGIVDRTAEQFWQVVAKARPKAQPFEQDLRSGRIVFGDQAIQWGLADALMTKNEAIKRAKALSKSERIFTREELRKMSEAASEGPSSGRSSYLGYQAPSWERDLAWAASLLRDAQRGPVVRFEHRMPYQFGD